MITPDDDSDVLRRMTDREMDALLRGPLAGFVSDLEALATAVPAPSAALAELLEQGLVPDTTLTPALPRRPRRAWLVAVPVAALVLGGTVGAASANVLPDEAQRAVSDVVSSITPIHLPRPVDKPRPTVAPTDRPSEDPVPGLGAQPNLPPAAVSHRATDVPRAASDGASDGHRQDDTDRDDTDRTTPVPVPAPHPAQGHRSEDRADDPASNETDSPTDSGSDDQGDRP